MAPSRHHRPRRTTTLNTSSGSALQGIGLAIKQVRENAKALDNARDAYLAGRPLAEVIDAFATTTNNKIDDNLRNAITDGLLNARGVFVQVSAALDTLADVIDDAVDTIDDLATEPLKAVLEGAEEEDDK